MRQKQFHVWIEETRKGSFLVRSQDDAGRRQTHVCVEKYEMATINGKRFTGRTLAKQYQKKIEAARHNENLGGFDLTQPLDALKDKFVAECERLRFSPPTIRHYEIDIRRAIEGLPARTLNDLTHERIAQWPVQMKGLKIQTVIGRMRGLRRFCNWLVTKRYLALSPFGKGVIPRAAEREPRYYTAEDFAALDGAAATIDPLFRLGVNLCHSAGLRKCELVGDTDDDSGVLWEDIAWNKDGTADLLLRKEIVKGGVRSRTVPLDAGVLALLGSRRSGPLVPIKRNAFDRLFKRARKAAGIRAELTIHGLRHTFAKNYLQRGSGNLASLKELMGHSDIKTTQIYAQFEKNYFRQGVEQAYEERKRLEAVIPAAGRLQGDSMKTDRKGQTAMVGHGLMLKSGSQRKDDLKAANFDSSTG